MPAPPSLKQAILERHPGLTAKHKRIADYLLANLRSAFTLSVAELAAASGVSEATVVRFARQLGFDGFSGLKDYLLKQVRDQLEPKDRFKLTERAEDELATLLRVAHQDVENINRTLEEIDEKQFRRFVEQVRGARQVFALGLGVSAILARLTAYLLRQVGIQAAACVAEESSFVEQLVLATRRDLVLALSFRPYSRETVEAVRFAHGRRVRCIAITDRESAPVRPYTSAHLLARTENILFTNSISAVSMIVNAVATEIGLLDKQRALAHLEEVERVQAGKLIQ